MTTQLQLDDATLFVESFLTHYSSQFYDPAKAHEYYIKNRELKGKRDVSTLKSEKKKEAWAYAEHQINQDKANKLKTAAQKRELMVEQARQAAEAQRQAITGKMKDLFKRLAEQGQQKSQDLSGEHRRQSETLLAQQKQEAKRISDEASNKIAALPAIPKGISKEEHDKLAAERSAKIAQIRGDATNQRTALSEKAKADRSSLSDRTQAQRKSLSGGSKEERARQAASVSDSRKKLSTDLKGVIEKARANYQSQVEKLKSQTEANLNKEFDAIKRNV